MQPGDRVALGNYKGHRYFVDPRVLLNSESAEELQWLWEHGTWRYDGSGSIAPSSWTADFWRFYTDRGFTYVVVAKNRMQDALSTWPTNLEGVRLQIAAVGRENGILKIAKQSASAQSVAAIEKLQSLSSPPSTKNYLVSRP